MEKKLFVSLKDAVTGNLPNKKGTFRVLIDEESSGAKNFAFLVNTSHAGALGTAHKHEVEHCFYILSGKGTMYIDDEKFDIVPEMAIFVPSGAYHKMDIDPEEDMTRIVIYAPPGPEQKLKQLGEHAFDEK